MGPILSLLSGFGVRLPRWIQRPNQRLTDPPSGGLRERLSSLERRHSTPVPWAGRFDLTAASA